MCRLARMLLFAVHPYSNARSHAEARAVQGSARGRDIMEDIFDFDIAAEERRSSPGVAPTARSVRGGSSSDGQELAAGEAIDIYHWAAVALVTALMCAVLGYAAGTPALSRAAN